MKLTLEKCEGKLFVNLPDDAVAALDWGHGDILEAEVSGEGLRIVRMLSAYDHAMEIARRGMEEYRETLEALAKS